MVLAPFLDLVEISAVCIERIIGFLMRPIVGDHGGQLIVVPYFSQLCPDWGQIRVRRQLLLDCYGAPRYGNKFAELH
jgi:hypothetical protein